MNILIAGSAGFLGAHLTKHYLMQGDCVYGVDHLGSGSKKNVNLFLKNGDYHFIEHDVSKPLPADLPHIDIILHFASRASPPDYQKHPFDTMDANYKGTYNLLELALAHNARFIYASTSEIYGNPPKTIAINSHTYTLIPTPEYFWGNVNSFGPRSCYDESKRVGEALVFEYIRKGVDARIVRIFNTYGPLMRPDDGRVVTNFIKQALNDEPLTIFGDGTQGRSYCFADDLIDGIAKVASFEIENVRDKLLAYKFQFIEKRPSKYLFDLDNDIKLERVFNVGNPCEHYSVLGLADLILELTNSNSSKNFFGLPKDDPQDRIPDITKISQVLGYSPKITLKQGLEKTISYFKEIL